MEIVIGKTAGFCFGVANAVNKTEELLKTNKNIFCLGELVHNKQVNDYLENNITIYLDLDSINISYEKILERLNKEDAYQVEFGTGGKNLSQLKMEEIKNLNLPGIDFIKSTKRYYPNGDFASYLLGYAKNKEIDGNLYMVGELGIEGYYNDGLTGSAGYITYEKDGRGNKIAN